MVSLVEIISHNSTKEKTESSTTVIQIYKGKQPRQLVAMFFSKQRFLAILEKGHLESKLNR